MKHSFNELVNFAKKFNRPVNFIDSFYNSQILKFNNNNYTTLVGYMGDPIAGSHLNLHDDWYEALNFFSDIHNKTTEIDLHNPNFNPLSVLPQAPLVSGNILFFDQLDFVLRQEYLVEPIVIANEEIYHSPFFNSEWSAFFYSETKVID